MKCLKENVNLAWRSQAVNFNIFSFKRLSAARKICVFLAIISTVNCWIIDCDYVEYDFVIIGRTITCDATLISSGNETDVIEVRGEHPNGLPTKDVWALNLIEDEWALNLNRIPQNIGVFFPNLRVIQWFPGNLTSISAADLEPFGELLMLHLWNNRIASLDANLFQHTPNLRLLVFSDNLLENVDATLFDGLQLNEAYFDNNPCVDMFAHNPETFAALIQAFQDQCPADPHCVIRADCEINSEVDALIARAEETEMTISSLNQEVADLRREVAELRELIMSIPIPVPI